MAFYKATISRVISRAPITKRSAIGPLAIGNRGMANSTKRKHEWIAIIPDIENALEKRLSVRAYVFISAS